MTEAEYRANCYYRRAAMKLDVSGLLSSSAHYVPDLHDAGASDELIAKAAEVNQALARAYELLDEIGPIQHQEFQRLDGVAS